MSYFRNRPARALLGLASGAASLALAVSACSSSSGSSASSSPSPGTTHEQSAFATKCASIRSRYSGIPTSIQVGISPFNRPYDYTNPTNPSQYIGVEPDLLAQISKCLGFSYSYIAENFANTIASVVSGRTPIGLDDLFLTPARNKELDYVTYSVSEDQVVAESSIAGRLHGPMDLCGLTTAVTTGGVELPYLQTLSKQCVNSGKKPISISILQDIASTFLAAANGRADFVVNSQVLTEPALRQYPGKLQASFLVSGLKFIVGIAVNKEQLQLAKAIDAAMQLLQSDGQEISILRKYGFPPSTQSPAMLHPAP
jgi:polar amino acid transport system substrate-binding protein